MKEKQNNNQDRLFRYKLRKPLEIYVPDLRQTIYTGRYPYIYLSANAIYLSDIKTTDSTVAFNSSVPRLFFSTLEDAWMAFCAIQRASMDGCRRLSIEEKDGGKIAFHFVYRDRF